MTCLKYFISTTIFLILTVNSFCTAQTVKLLCERYRTEWNWIEYRISLENTSALPILNPEIHYYAADTNLSVAADYVSYLYSVNSTVTPVSDLSDIKFSILGLLYPNNKIDLNFRLYKKDWSAHSFAKDWSYQKNENIAEPNYFMTVYDVSNNILWGSDPINGNYNTGETLTWTDRGVNSTVLQYDGNDNEYLPAGRFWLFKDTPLSPKERDLLAQRGISKLSIGRSRGKIVAVFKSNSNIQKKSIDSLIAGFYNAIPIADTIPIIVELTNEDLYNKREVCYDNSVCQTEMEPKPDLKMDISCWADVNKGDCFSTIKKCGGSKIGIMRGSLVATIALDSLQCLAKNTNIETLTPQRKMEPQTTSVHSAINISSIQSSAEWLTEQAKERAYLGWLDNADYTGKGIVVGVYEDNTADFNHPTFNEYDSQGHLQTRLIQENEFYGVNYNAIWGEMNVSIKNDSLFSKIKAANHGTAVAGLLGGNGNNSNNFEFRGIAPKIHFYPFAASKTNQIGHVVNHSHTTTNFFYSLSDYLYDYATFYNWKSECTIVEPSDSTSDALCVEGDTLAKTVVFGAANAGAENQVSKLQGYHSIQAPSKNPINVGMIIAENKIRAPISSMGPTWDGRIKPDIMAPGISSQFVTSESNPFEVWIDYIKFYRQEESTPYINIDFDTNHFNINEVYPNTNPCSENEHFLHCTINHHVSAAHPPARELYIALRLNEITKISPSDEIEIRYNISNFTNSNDTLYGAIRFEWCKNSNTTNVNCNKYGFSKLDPIFIPWEISGNFKIARAKINKLHFDENKYFKDSINASSIRIDFDFSKGITTPGICHNDSCDYAFESDGGCSFAAPIVSGVAALMYEKFKKETGEPLNKHSMRNSTVKSLLIHTAIDMQDSEKAHMACNTDITSAHHDGNCHFTPYGKGPDFATGWGYIDGKAALDLIDNYDTSTNEFPKFKEIEIGNGVEKRWIIHVDSTRNRLRTSLVWDDAPGNKFNAIDTLKFKDAKLINDIDMYLISPSGKYYYPWRLEPLPTTFIDANGSPATTKTGLEYIHEQKIDSAYNHCFTDNVLDYNCFDHINNVEVVDVDNPELGKWQIVVFGRSITEFNNASNNAQVASLVSDFDISAENKFYTANSCNAVKNYAPQTDYTCVYELGNKLIYYVTFHDSTFVGDGDNIVLTDGEGKNIGIYTGRELSGRTITVKSKKMTITLHSNNDKSQGWGFDITRIRSIDKAILTLPFEAIKKKRRNQ